MKGAGNGSMDGGGHVAEHGRLLNGVDSGGDGSVDGGQGDEMELGQLRLVRKGGGG